MRETAKGIWALMATFTIWGLSPLFYKQLAQVDPGTVLAHRTLWSLVFFAALLALQGRLRQVAGLLRLHPVAVPAAALLISCNWFVFIWAVQVGRTVESSLGYYIFPLVSVLLGRVVLGERLARVQWIAVAMVATAVALLTYGLGAMPQISLLLAATFGLYGLFKRRMEAGPVLSVAAEVAVLAPLAMLWLLWSSAPYGMTDAQTTGLLMLAGPITAVPLILFSYGSRRVAMATTGLLQYLNPTLQFLCAVLVFTEPFSLWHAAAFTLIWLGVAVYSVSALLSERRSRRAAKTSSVLRAT
ncbi:EamA family transporter RarD [Alphaproteobacteria bacterium KMM 3653]|uniref:EamA family transporter RarD n=1 Tax=Harenicola maris TaxID=2841044 RepID=A0AAP2G7E3_9RHOB|nr:EamA family transporter RarD [Harenicola maris]